MRLPPTQQQSKTKAFQSTHLLRGATRPQTVRKCRTIFQSTHPLRGATYLEKGYQPVVDISIHAPHAGCDRGHRPMRSRHDHFNPRTPCGVRPDLPKPPAIPVNFNPRTPCGVRQSLRHRGNLLFYFNPRTPCGVRLEVIYDNRAGRHFNPRTPCGVRQYATRRSCP